tara:strand:+ start:108 stop:482 length:375 start_codon:yes stop_codon:yes gene_type:complete
MPQGRGTYGSKVGRPSKKKFDDGGAVTISIIPMSRKMDDDFIDATDVISLEGRDAMFIEGNEEMFDEPEKKKKVKKKKDGGMVKYKNGFMDGGMVKYKNGGTIKGCGSAVTGKSYNDNNGSGTF